MLPLADLTVRTGSRLDLHWNIWVQKRSDIFLWLKSTIAIPVRVAIMSPSQLLETFLDHFDMR